VCHSPLSYVFVAVVVVLVRQLSLAAVTLAEIIGVGEANPVLKMIVGGGVYVFRLEAELVEYEELKSWFVKEDVVADDSVEGDVDEWVEKEVTDETGETVDVVGGDCAVVCMLVDEDEVGVEVFVTVTYCRVVTGALMSTIEVAVFVTTAVFVVGGSVSIVVLMTVTGGVLDASIGTTEYDLDRGSTTFLRKSSAANGREDAHCSKAETAKMREVGKLEKCILKKQPLRDGDERMALAPDRVKRVEDLHDEFVKQKLTGEDDESRNDKPGELQLFSLLYIPYCVYMRCRFENRKVGKFGNGDEASMLRSKLKVPGKWSGEKMWLGNIVRHSTHVIGPL